MGFHSYLLLLGKKLIMEQLFFPSRNLPHFPLYKLNTRICISRDLGVGEQEWEMEDTAL